MEEVSKKIGKNIRGIMVQSVAFVRVLFEALSRVFFCCGGTYVSKRRLKFGLFSLRCFSFFFSFPSENDGVDAFRLSSFVLYSE